MERELAQRFAALPPESQRLFLEKLQLKGFNFGELPIIAANRQRRIPLSYAQRSLWLTWKLEPDSSAYNMPGVLSVKGKINIGVLQASIDALVQRHEVLRTIYPSDDNLDPQQQVLAQWQVPLICHDIRSGGAAWIESLPSQVTHFIEQSFSLDAKPPFRVALFNISDDEALLCFSLHHIACDGWSVDIFIEEFFGFYKAFSAAKEPTVATLPIQYADYVVWQRNWFDAGERENQIRYWQNRLGTEHPVLNLPFDKSRQAAADLSGGDHVLRLSAALSDQLRAMAREHDASLYMVILSLLTVLLHRFSGQTDIRIGSPAANRQRVETHGLIGYFTNLQVLRTQIAPGHSFQTLLHTVRETVLEAQSHQDMPFDLLVETLQPERHAGVHPLFQVKCTQQTASSARWSVAGLDVSALEIAGGKTHFDFSLDFIDDPEGIHCIFAYVIALFEPGTVARLAHAFLDLAEQVVVESTLPLASLTLPEPLSLLRGETVVRPNADVVAMWDCAVEYNAQRDAVRCEEISLTYAELDRRANRLAHMLVAQGIGPDSRVGIHASRSCEFVLGVLAVLKAGGAYVPLDPQLPAERLAWQLVDSNSQLLLAAESPSFSPAIPVIELDALASEQHVAEPVASILHPLQAAYLIYTSGSTGKPKGVVVTRAALANYVQAMLEKISLPEDARSIAMISTVAADLGHTSFFGTLCSGRCLHLISHQRAFDPDGFAQYMRQYRVDALKIVPSHLQALLQASNAADVLPATALILGGEPTHRMLLETIFTLKPACRVFNHYGPTETTIGVLMQPAQRALKQSASLPLGLPIENTFAAVLDNELNPVPCGVEGELYLGGKGIARGYDGRAALTAERFIADPFHAGERLYRSGDKVRQLQDGSLVFLGRVDDQIKIRGYRVEPDEVRAAIFARADVRDAAVLVATTDDGRNQLQAFLVPQSHSYVDVDVVKTTLAQTLPDYMVPTRIALLDELPLTTNGKLDRKALLANPLQEEVKPIELPSGMYEELVANIWKDLLRIDQVGRGDNFFALGGDSVLGLKLIARIRRTVPGGEQFAMTDLMQTATLFELVARLQNQLEHMHDAVCLNAGGAGIPLYCLPGLICNTREFASLASALRDDRPVYTFVSHVYTRNRWRGFSIEALAAEYASFIKATAPAKRCALLGWSSGGDLAIEVARQLQGVIEVDFLGMLDVFETEPLRPQLDLTDTQRHEANARLDRWLAASTMSSHWQALLARMDDIERKFIAEQLMAGESLPLDGDGDEAHEYLLWATMDKRTQATRYEYPRVETPIHVFHAEKSLHGDGVLRDWSISSRIAATSTIPQASHLDIIHHSELHSQIRYFIRLAEGSNDTDDEGSKR